MADYQFGDGAGDDFLGTRHRRVATRNCGCTTTSDEQLAAMVPQYGTLSFTLAGARRWVESGARSRRVEIDAFAPHGSVLAPGVVDADDDIRPGDEVVIEGPKAFAIGRAEMSGPEMAEVHARHRYRSAARRRKVGQFDHEFIIRSEFIIPMCDFLGDK